MARTSLRAAWAVAAALLALLPLGVSAGEVRWRTTRTKHFIIYYAEGRESDAGRPGSAAERWHSVLSRKLGFTPGGVTPIYLYPDRRSFSEATGVEPAQAVVGLAHTKTLCVRVDASGLFSKVDKVIAHELVHIFIYRKLRWYASRLPLWMHEGLAKYLSEDWSEADAQLIQDLAAGGRLLPFERISHNFPADERARSIAYVQSYSVVKYMADRYGPACIPDLLSEIEAGRPFHTALRYSIGVDPWKLEDDWRLYLWEEYRPYRWWKFASGAISSLMVILAILAFRARLRRKRLKTTEFEEETPGVTDHGMQL